MRRLLPLLVLVAACGSSTAVASADNDTDVPYLVTAQAHTSTSLLSQPGAVDPRVTQANVAQTICGKGWSAKVRPSLADTEKVKRDLYRQQHLSGSFTRWELDHVIPLEVGGAPIDPGNLWLEPIKAARRADQVENQAHRDVCAGKKTLQQARQTVIDWKRRHG